MGTDFDIAIVGGGYTGAVLMLHLLRWAPGGTKVIIIEPRNELGSGVAYSTPIDEHRINVPAEKMGVGPAAPDRFDVWLRAKHPELVHDDDPEHTYVARRWFGVFVRDRLREALEKSSVELLHVQTEARSVFQTTEGAEALLSNGGRLRARHLVIAVGHGLPALPQGVPPELSGERGFIENPWDIDRLAEIPPAAAVLIIGTGLTMADVVSSLVDRRHSGPITAISRHGLLSQKSGPAAVPPGLDLATWPPAKLAGYVKSIRDEIGRAKSVGFSWRGVFTALRIQSAHLWSHLTPADKRRFLRHVKPFYDAHRYRMAPENYELLEAAEARGQLKILAARIINVQAADEEFDVTLRRHGGIADETLRVARIVNCTGPKQKLRADQNSFLGSLIANGIAKTDPLELGLAVDHDFRLIGNADNFYAVGPLTRERFGDTYGAPEIEVQAERLARLIATTLSKERMST